MLMFDLERIFKKAHIIGMVSSVIMIIVVVLAQVISGGFLSDWTFLLMIGIGAAAYAVVYSMFEITHYLGEVTIKSSVLVATSIIVLPIMFLSIIGLIVSLFKGSEGIYINFFFFNFSYFFIYYIFNFNEVNENYLSTKECIDKNKFDNDIF